MKKKLILWCTLSLILILFFLFFSSFTKTDASNLYLTVDYENNNGWEISGIENGEEVPYTATQAIECTETVFLRRPATENWASYSRINIDTGRAVSVFVDNSLVFSNHTAALSLPGELPLMQKPENQPFSLVFSMNPQWVGKTVTIVTRLYENEPYGSIGFDLVNDEVFLLQHEAWVNQKALPGAMFGILSLFLLGLFLFEFSTRKKGFSLLFLAFASLLQMLYYMSVLSENPLPIIDRGVATSLYFLFPLLYLGTKLTDSKKSYYIAILSTWGLYFTLFAATFIFYLPVPYWFDKVELLCFLPLAIMFFYCFKERGTTLFLRHFLSLLGMVSAGYVLLFFVTAVLDMPLNQTILILFKEASRLYCGPLLFWIFTSILFVLFILAVWDLLQERILAAKQMEQMQSEQAMLNLQIESAKDQLDSLRTANEQTRIYRHDMRHHLSLLSSFVTDGDIHKAREYIHAAESDIDAVTPVRYCENETVNLILSSFVNKADKSGVSLSVKAELPESLALPDTELCAVLSNGLENAIAAAALVPKEQRKVRIHCKLNRDKLLIFIENTCIEKVELVNGLPKADKPGHGFGTKSIVAMAEKRNGNCTCEAQDDLFCLRVVLPLR